jgi:CRP-like cAMP-binding protein
MRLLNLFEMASMDVFATTILRPLAHHSPRPPVLCVHPAPPSTRGRPIIDQVDLSSHPSFALSTKMGSGASVQLSPRGGHVVEGGEVMEVSASRKILRNDKRIFERQPSNINVDISSLLNGDEVDENAKKLIINALSGFFFLQSSAEDANPKMDMLIRGMKREEVHEGSVLITEGESGSKLYVVERGNLEVTINGTVIREMTSGALLGELALLYDAPRSATVIAKTECVLWTLSRDIFKRIQTISATANQIQRARWLIGSPELATLSAIDLSRLVGTLQMVQVADGETVFVEGEISNQIILIEKGHGAVTSTIASKSVAAGANVKLVDKELNIYRPREGKRRSVDTMNVHQLGKFLAGKNGGSIDDSMHEGEEEAGPTEAPPETLCEVYEGCTVGIGSLRGKAGMPNCWKWSKEGKTEGGVSPLTLKAMGPMTILVFTVDVFENLFGPAGKVLHAQEASKKGAKAEEEKPKVKEMQFDSTKFKQKFILGSGSFGVVTLAEYRADKNSTPMLCALKSLSKLAVIETGQLRHVLDERRILAYMDSPFILKLYGTYQTPHQLVMVTEPLNCGDLWSVIYETAPFCDNCGIPFDLAAFYTTCLVHGLSHIHEKGVVFRDLKPENIMLDEKGYLRIIDFGFSKKVPYTKTDAHGEVKVYAKTYTLCGTPGKTFSVAPLVALELNAFLLLLQSTCPPS